ncbi:hypothetical protein BAUCODRAFT_149398 [Baudoinia panamericana UAMH 10762]|uniref:Multicopper oxidase n=1 Tax=Baudoinia panamericana (strain UAMH 10762) TaxID=717646 RepID=M2MV15_BAUPA|nr:uncharacterized protein BAUCODRAFT_149398 [Baudoinia panamericana UAMH 10762]EMC95423.1 hypothetical protein BAUCODRAFT_149398 [Baudoinia panamericana UAMH 10762]
MAPVPKFVATFLYAFGIWTPDSWKPSIQPQQPLLEDAVPITSPGSKLFDGAGHGPIFQPPNSPEIDEFICDYTAMKGYLPCSAHSDRGCWLRNPLTRSEFTINTDYEQTAPIGVVRSYHLYASEMNLTLDGVLNTDGQVFNRSYPGPAIRACWGDTIEVTVHNNLKNNGTTARYQAARYISNGELNRLYIIRSGFAHPYPSYHQDGVNAITQCAIAPGQQLTYRFHAIQYGTSWYHSHYSLQYANGLLGPLIIYGPMSANYDTAKDPLLISDWRHMGAFRAWELGFPNQTSQSITIDGVGTYNGPGKYTTFFQKGIRYLFRLINTSVDTTFIFSIDGHWLQVIEADFVPIKPYGNSSVLIGIGQRYNIIVSALPNVTSPDGNYWIRTVSASGGCARFDNPQPDNRTGIVRYNPFSKSLPSTSMWEFATLCSDETYSSLEPVVPWEVHWNGTSFNHVFVADRSSNTWPPYWPNASVPRFELADMPMWLNYTSPTLLNLNADFSQQKWLAVVETDNDLDAWVVLLITEQTNQTAVGKQPLPLAHPIHLHGHDFALLVQSSTPYTTIEEVRERMQLHNPPRRDVALLPLNGYLVIAFKADNPAAWIMHCHIAWHASSGLAAQILENPKRITIDKPVLAEMQETCRTWTDWWEAHGGSKNGWQDDSGI